MKDSKYEVWIEGYDDNGGRQDAQRLVKLGEKDTMWSGINFQQACVRALNELHWTILSTMIQGLGTSIYDYKNNSYWGCRFYDNEIDAKKSFR